MIFWKTFCSLGACWMLAQSVAFASAAEITPAHVPYSYEAELVSTHTQHRYRIQWTVVGEQPSDGYPVLYLLDGDTTFAPAAIAAHSLLVNKISGQNTPLLIVGIGYPNGQLLDLNKRAKDYTPALRAGASMQEQQKFGGADAFLQFIDEELTAFLQAHTPINNKKKAIFGHSYGGLFAAYSLLNYPQKFQYHIISSPSIWWHDKRLLDFANHYQQVKNIPVRLTVGALEKVRDENDIRRKQRDMYGNWQAFAQQLQQHGAKVTQQVYEGETHGSVIFKALIDGLQSLPWSKAKP